MQKDPKLADRLVRIIEQFPKLSITVLGDLIADEFIYGEISRVSREAPVLILRHRERTVVPGGAGNAIYNLADLGVTVLPVGGRMAQTDHCSGTNVFGQEDSRRSANHRRAAAVAWSRWPDHVIRTISFRI